MSRRRLFAVLVGVAVMVAGSALSSDSASAITASQANVSPGKCWQNGAGNCYHWARTSTGLTLRVERDVSGAWQSYLATAVGPAPSGWTSNTVAPLTGNAVPLTLSPQDSYGTSPSCAGITGVSRVCNKKYGFNGWLGLASIWISSDGEHITAGTVKLNDSYFNSGTYNTAAWRNLVMCQELAHTLGLNHEDEKFDNPNLNSCMDYTNSPTSNQYPSLADRQTLANMYAHADSSSTVSATGSAGSRGGLGQVLGDEDALPPNAKPEQGDVFAKHLPNGQTLITHVFWVDRGNPDH